MPGPLAFATPDPQHGTPRGELVGDPRAAPTEPSAVGPRSPCTSGVSQSSESLTRCRRRFRSYRWAPRDRSVRSPCSQAEKEVFCFFFEEGGHGPFHRPGGAPQRRERDRTTAAPCQGFPVSPNRRTEDHGRLEGSHPMGARSSTGVPPCLPGTAATKTGKMPVPQCSCADLAVTQRGRAGARPRMRGDDVAVYLDPASAFSIASAAAIKTS